MGFKNGDPRAMKFYIKWLDLHRVSRKDLICRLTINQAFKHQEKHLKKFWVQTLRIPEQQFSKTTIIKTRLKKAIVHNQRTYSGVLRVKVRRGLDLKNRILGALDYIGKDA